jgi:hypothetical protein
MNNHLFPHQKYLLPIGQQNIGVKDEPSNIKNNSYSNWNIEKTINQRI